ncbi:MAG: hypothetical protein HQL35_08595 [Alphaproteobacteria bacterium]|nr:hypothetical protein [Alphaproteobacteria bacterium]
MPQAKPTAQPETTKPGATPKLKASLAPRTAKPAAQHGGMPPAGKDAIHVRRPQGTSGTSGDHRPDTAPVKTLPPFPSGMPKRAVPKLRGGVGVPLGIPDAAVPQPPSTPTAMLSASAKPRPRGAAALAAKSKEGYAPTTPKAKAKAKATVAATAKPRLPTRTPAGGNTAASTPTAHHEAAKPATVSATVQLRPAPNVDRYSEAMLERIKGKSKGRGAGARARSIPVPRNGGTVGE